MNMAKHFKVTLSAYYNSNDIKKSPVIAAAYLDPRIFPAMSIAGKCAGKDFLCRRYMELSREVIKAVRMEVLLFLLNIFYVKFSFSLIFKCTAF